ncbi:MAG: 4-alpha-glucanotransferase, partial [Lachnospiraceae bacterium]
MRKSGVLLPISSIWSRYGIGTFSKESYTFVDFLQQAGQKLWQILPLGPTGYGDSPYQSFSTFAGNPYFIDLEEFIEKGFLTKEECQKADFGENPQYVDYERLFYNRFKLLRKAYERSNILDDDQFRRFVRENAFWLEDYCL